MRQLKWTVIAGTVLLAGAARAATSDSSAPSDASSPSSTGSTAGGSSMKSHGMHKGSHAVVGTVEDVSGDTITVKSSKTQQTQSVQLGDDTKYTEHGKSITKDDIKQGDRIRASVKADSSGKLTASTVHVLRTPSGSATGSTGSAAGSGPGASAGTSGTGSSGSTNSEAGAAGSSGTSGSAP